MGNGNACRNNSKQFVYYENCAGNKLVYNGFSILQYNLDLAIKKV